MFGHWKVNLLVLLERDFLGLSWCPSNRIKVLKGIIVIKILININNLVGCNSWILH